MASTEKIINSFYLQDELNPDVWILPNEKFMGDPEGQKPKIKPEIRERLLKVAEIFIDFFRVIPVTTWRELSRSDCNLS
jgi:hypothetical protein